MAISVEPAKWERLKGKLDDAGVPYQMESGTSIYFRDPDGARDGVDRRPAWRDVRLEGPVTAAYPVRPVLTPAHGAPSRVPPEELLLT